MGGTRGLHAAAGEAGAADAVRATKTAGVEVKEATMRARRRADRTTADPIARLR